jgi:hypothetical protein
VNPASSAAPAKLRLVYECAPLAFIIEVGQPSIPVHPGSQGSYGGAAGGPEAWFQQLMLMQASCALCDLLGGCLLMLSGSKYDKLLTQLCWNQVCLVLHTICDGKPSGLHCLSVATHLVTAPGLQSSQAQHCLHRPDTPGGGVPPCLTGGSSCTFLLSPPLPTGCRRELP